MAIIFVSVICTQGQSQDPQGADLQQMRDKLEELEREMQDLKGQISAVERASQSPAAATTSSTPGAQGAAEKPPAAAAKNNIDLYGFVMLDSGYEFGQSDPIWFDVMRPTKLASFNREFAPDGKVYFSVRQTRFGVKTSTPTRFGDFKTLFEFELFGTGVDAGQTTFRLRHAYGELGQFGAGQTWSLFMDPDLFPNQLEYWGPNGIAWFRNVQVRWMPVRSDRMHLMFGVERPGASADQGPYAGRVELQGVVPKFDMPDFTWQARVMRHWGYVQLAGLFRKITWVDTAPNPKFHLGDTVLGWGLNLSSNINFGKNDTGRFDVIYGDGIENYMNDAPVDIGVKNNFANPVRPILGVPLPVLSVTSFLDHNWNERFSTSIGYSMLNIENSNAQNPSDFHQGHYALANLLYHPTPPVTIGSEFQYGRRVNFTDGFNVNDYRLQFSFKYDWKKGFEF
jgi:hypothetical protein